MTAVPQLGPEVYVEDIDEDVKEARTTVSPMLSPSHAADPRGSFIAHGLDGARARRGTDASLSGWISPRNSEFAGTSALSPQMSPRNTLHRANPSAFSFEGSENFNHNISPAGSADNSRRGSTAENVLEVLDNSAWGESIRRSFTMRRPPGENR